MELTQNQLELIEFFGFQICEFKLDGDCCGDLEDCPTPPGGNVWFEPDGDPEYPSEGNHFCDLHVLQRIEELQRDNRRLENTDWDAIANEVFQDQGV